MHNAFVLIVDNHADASADRSRLLSSAGIKIIEASSGSEALRIAQNNSVSVAILKDGLTDMSAFDLCRELKSRVGTAEIRVLHVSSAPDRDLDHVAALDNGADLYLHEPCSTTVLTASVRALARSWSLRSHALAENAVEAIFLTDAKGCVTFANPAAEQLFGWSQAEFAQRRLHDAIHYKRQDGNPYPANECPIEKVLATGEPLERYEDVFYGRNGEPLHATGSNVPIIRDGGVVGSVVVLSGISESRRADDRFRRLAAEATVGVFTGDLTGSITYCNAVFLELIGYPESEPVLSWRDFTTDSAFVTTCFKTLQDQGTCEPRETILRSRDGSRIPVAISATVLERHPDGAADVAAYVTDLRSIREAEHALRCSEERRLLAVEAADMGTWFYDLRSGQLTWDDRCYAVFGIDPATPLDYSRFLETVHPGDRTHTDSAVNRAITRLEDYDIEYRILLPDGDVRWISAKGRAHIDLDGKADRLQGIAIDITDRKRSEQRLTHVNDALQRSNTDLQEFTYAISHDLQEPLRMVTNFGDLIEKRHASSLSEEGREFFRFMIDGAQRMDRMIRDLLVYSRILHDQGTFEPTELEASLLWAMSNLDAMIQESGASVTYGELPTVRGDFVRLSQLFQNLLSNAIKYHGAQPPSIHVSAEASEEQWTLAVKDNGIGMDPKNAQRAFGVFRRMHGADYPGSGVGLAICKRIVERHGGRIWMETAIGAGSTLFFTLPCQ